MVAPELRSVLEPPAGWGWYAGQPTQSTSVVALVITPSAAGRRTSPAQWRERMQSMQAWIEENDVPVSSLRQGGLRTAGPGSLQIQVAWRVFVDLDLDRGESNLIRDLDCPYCGAGIDNCYIACPECEGMLACRSCNTTLSAVLTNHLWHLDIVNQEEQAAAHTGPNGEVLGCTSCYGQCSWREPVTPSFTASTLDPLNPIDSTRCENACYMRSNACGEHTEWDECHYCGGRIMTNNAYTIADQFRCCQRCWRRRCNICGDEGTQTDGFTDQILCPRHYEERMQGRIEVHDADAVMDAEQLLLPALPNRPIRVMSIEQEFVGGSDMRAGNSVASGLYDMGICWAPERLGYHSGHHDHPCHVERDSSVESGGELIHNRFLLSREEDATMLHQILEYMTSRVADGSILFDVRCGMHTHVDIHGYTFADCRGLVTLFNWMEDPIFRLAGAGYADHRAITHGSTYANSIRKGNWKTDREFGVEYLRNVDHADALNLLNFYQSLRQKCQCGAVEFGDLAQCTCNRGKATAEWRVFNGTTNPRKMHAYLAFMQSVHAYVQDRDIDPDVYEPLAVNTNMTFNGELDAGHLDMIDAWKPRVQFWFTHLPMTDGERDSMVYTMKRSPLIHLGEDYIDSLLSLPRVVDNRTITAPDFAARSLTGGGTPRPRTDPYDDDTCGGCGNYYDDCMCRYCDEHECYEYDCSHMTHGARPSETPTWGGTTANISFSSFIAENTNIDFGPADAPAPDSGDDIPF